MPQISIEEFLKRPVLKPELYIVAVTFEEDGSGFIIERLSQAATSHLQAALYYSGVPHRWTSVPAPESPRWRCRLALAWRKLLLLLRAPRARTE